MSAVVARLAAWPGGSGAAALYALAVVPLVPGWIALGFRSAAYQSIALLQYMEDGWLPWWLRPLSQPSHGQKEYTRAQRDFGDNSYKMWWDMGFDIVLVLVVMVSLSGVVDWWLGGLRVSQRGALRVRCVADLLISALFLFKLYGLYLLSVPVHALLSWAVVRAVVLVSDLAGQGRPRLRKALRVCGLVAVWAGNFALVLNAKDVGSVIVEQFRALEHQFRRSLLQSGAKEWKLAPILLEFSGNSRFTLFRALDYATHVLLNELDQEEQERRRVPPAKDPIKGGGQRSAAAAVPELFRYLQYVCYAPLVWQGPLVSWRDFNSQAQRRYRETRLPDGRLGPLRVRRRDWARAAGLVVKLALVWLAYEVLCHNVFAKMLFRRAQFQAFASGEVLALMLALFLSDYSQVVFTWTYFELWAALDGTAPPPNFPKPVFSCVSVGEMWKNYNASVQLWTLGNIYRPLCEFIGLPQVVGTVGTFLFMWVWHEPAWMSAWMVFSVANCVVTLWEQNAERPLLQRLTGGSRAWLERAIWALKVSSLFFCWLDFARHPVVHADVSGGAFYFKRSFWNDTLVPPARVADPARPYPFVAIAAATGDAWWSQLLCPWHTLPGALATLLLLRLAAETLVAREALRARAAAAGDTTGAAAAATAGHLPASTSSGKSIANNAEPTARHEHERLREQAEANARATLASCRTVCDVLAKRAREEPGAPALVWLDGQGREAGTRTFGELDGRARELARTLGARGVRRGDRVVLVYPPGIAFVEAIFACMYAGVVAVPVYPPDPRAALARDRVFGGVLRNSRPALVLTDTSFAWATASLALQRRLAAAPSVAGAARAMARRAGPGVQQAVAVLLLLLPAVLSQVLVRVRLSLKPVVFWSLGTTLSIPDAEFKEGDEIGVMFGYNLDTLVLAAATSLSVSFLLVAEPLKGRRREAAVKIAHAHAQPAPEAVEDVIGAAPLAVDDDDQTPTVPWARSDSVADVVMPARWAATLRSLLRPLLGGHRGRGRGQEQLPLPLPDLAPSSVAYLQYTSGSTAEPKGVRITHGNLMHQGFVNQVSFGCVGRGETGVNWCPQYHDLGLVVCLLSGVFAGIRVVAMSPADFLRDPLLWLRAISKYRAEFSAAPNFAYAYAARKARAAAAAGQQPLRGVDLACWRVAGNGGEPVRAPALEAFCARFAPHGFRRHALFPCFGLAEHTILASGRRAWRAPTYLLLDAARLSGGGVAVRASARPEAADAAAAAAAAAAGPEPPGLVRLVGCGEPFPGVEVRIVDPERLRDLGREHAVGEIWIDSPSVGAGYWGRSDEDNAAAFRAQLRPPLQHDDDAARRWLRTGDLGFLHDGELFICGRLKDLLIVDGRNVYPQDIEAAAERACHQLVRPGSSAAFAAGARDPALESSSSAAHAHLTLVLEVRRERSAPAHLPAPALLLRAAARAAVAVQQQQRVQLTRVVLAPAGALPKTSSGKIQRRATAALLAAGNIRPLLDAHGAQLLAAAADEAAAANDQDRLGQGQQQQQQQGEAVVDAYDDPHHPLYANIVLALLRSNLLGKQQPASHNDLHVTDELLGQPLSDLLGGDAFSSLETVQFASALESNLRQVGVDNFSVAPDLALKHATVAKLANHIYNAVL
jgi:acyl-CoA synthetase (AMP-forming)/AMP-acid ligase II/D-alanyl-lipoteichoic acid acyltransferase DltB (MBOAT superfamily)